jgi:hypothetical protein
MKSLVVCIEQRMFLLNQGPKRLETQSEEPAADTKSSVWLARSQALRRRASQVRWKHWGLLLFYVLAAVQFVGAYIYLEFPFVDVQLWERGYAPLPFQTRLLLAPLYKWVGTAPWSVHLAANLAHNNPYFFPTGLTPEMMLEFFVGIGCVLLSGWVACKIYAAATRRNLLGPLVFPIFLMLCVVSYVLHTVQNFRYMYDLPSQACFALGFYLLYFRKPVFWFVALFAIGTLNRETTLLLLPFFVISQAMDPHDTSGRISLKRLLRPSFSFVLFALLGYWVVWHHVVYRIFADNVSQYYSRVLYNLKFFLRLRYWPQLASAFSFTWPFLIAFRTRVKDHVLRKWLIVLPFWYALMIVWAVITETRVFGELFPMLAPVCALMAEEVLAERMKQSPATVEASFQDSRAA